METAPPPKSAPSQPSGADKLWLVILWSAREPQRIGERALCEEDQLLLLGRAPQGSEDETALNFAAERPGDAGGATATGSEILGEALSRRQLEIRVEGNQLLVRNVGRCPMWVNGSLISRAQVGHGDTIHLQQQLLLLCVKRPRILPSLCTYPGERLGAFGFADEDGLVGESHAMWTLRQQLALCSQSDGHVLIVGKSGTGKELVAKALHNLSPQSSQVYLSENIATVPASLGSAMLFGNRRNFPNPGMEERPGLIGLAERGTLFLDEIGDMNPEVQPLLLRVMERSGEYMRMGDEGQPRRANVRFLGATNHPERLRHELRRRFHHEIHISDLNDRREDIPLLIRHILASRAQRLQTLTGSIQSGQPSTDPRLIEQLVRHSYFTHIAELAFLIEQAFASCENGVLLPLHPEVLHRRSESPSPGPAVVSGAPSALLGEPPKRQAPPLPTAVEAQRALELASGSVAKAAQRLGISRHQLNRLIRRQQRSVERSPDAKDDSSDRDEGA